VDSADRFLAVHALVMGLVPGAVTVTFTARLSDPAGQVHLVSSSTSDTQAARVIVLDADTGLARVEVVQLDGTTKVSGLLGCQRLLGVELLVAAVGTITITIEDGSATITSGTIAAGADSFACRRQNLAVVGNVSLQLSATPPSTEVVAVWGLDEDGALAAEAFWLEDAAKVPGLQDWTTIYGIATAGLDPDLFVTVTGTAWRFAGPREVAAGLALLPGWTATTPTSSFDAILDANGGQDLTEGVTRNFSGEVSVTEDTTITAIDSTTLQVTTEAISGSFAINDRMRERT
jgi:hypothetical protein